MAGYRRFFLSLIWLIVIGLTVAALRTERARAQKLPPRWREEKVVETLYYWWLLPWKDPNHVACVLKINHPEEPTPDDIYRFCGWDLYKAWSMTPACQAALQGGDITTCEGYYLHFVKQEIVSHTVLRVYPPPQVHLSLQNCIPDLPHFRCPAPVSLQISAEEPLPDAKITALNVRIFGQPTRHCAGNVCELSLPARGQSVTYSLQITAISTEKHSNRTITAKVRLTPAQAGGTVVDVLGEGWRDEGADMCSQAWEALPPVQHLPDWARTPADAQGLETQVPYVYLAGRLIASGVVDAADCPHGGLESGGVASPCGLQHARTAVLAWQNQFDPEIWNAARQTGIPAVLFKRLLARESQFWPGKYPRAYEVGFGQLSPAGMDTLLLWDTGLFRQMCNSMLGVWKCLHGYPALSSSQRNFLYGSLWVQADLTCSDCDFGIDMQRVPDSLDLFARLLRAHCWQIGQTIRNIAHTAPGRIATYEDLWRFTIADYNCPDCIYEALLRTYRDRAQGGPRRMDWEHVRAHFPAGCEATLDYVEDILPPTK